MMKSRYTALHHDKEQDSYFRAVLTAYSADDVQQKIQQFLYEKQLKEGDFKKEDELDLLSFGETLFVTIGDHPNLISPDSGVDDLIIPEGWVPDPETPEE